MMLCYRIFLLVCLVSARVTGNQTYTIRVKTGDDFGAGTNGDVLVTLYGTEGKSHEQNLDTNGNDFERWSTGMYTLTTRNSLGDVGCIRVNFNHKGVGDGWKLDFISVEGTGVTVTFNYNGWLKKDKKIDIFKGDGGCKDNSCDCLEEVRGGGYCSSQANINRCQWSCYSCRTSTSSAPTTTTVTTTISTSTAPVTTRSSNFSEVRTSHNQGSTTSSPLTSQPLVYTYMSSSASTRNTGTTAGIAVGGVLALVIVVGAVVLVVCIRKRRRDSSEQKSYQASFKVTNPGYSNVSGSLEITSENGRSTFPNVSPETGNNTQISDLYSTPRKPVINGITNGPLSEQTDLDDLYSKPIKPKKGGNSESRDTSTVSDLNLKPQKNQLKEAGHYEGGIENVGYGVAGSPNENVDMVTNDMYGDLCTSGGDVIFADNDIYEAGTNPEDQVYADGDVVKFVSNEIYA